MKESHRQRLPPLQPERGNKVKLLLQVTDISVLHCFLPSSHTFSPSPPRYFFNCVRPADIVRLSFSGKQNLFLFRGCEASSSAEDFQSSLKKKKKNIILPLIPSRGG
eukprot:TRINITY_DN14365_c0_g1_i1.p1 TRINITY_DN14365_c0_g1~~TRINITY_DN14365_c0_g1_i1.p1  ORF type:complete len:107 (+),score=0.62 TRINITY_DN14365_c0_g1_i1:1629-1949(+)